MHDRLVRALGASLAFALPTAAAAQAEPGANLLRDGHADRPGTAWTRGGPGDYLLDRKRGKPKPPSLRVGVTEATKGVALWAQRVAFDDPLTTAERFRLSASVRAIGIDPPGQAAVMVQCWNGKEAVDYAWADRISKDQVDGEWHDTSVVFEAPAGCTHLRVLAYVNVSGRAWFDDLRLVRTDEPVSARPTAQPRGGGADDELEARARRAAAELPWRFDAAAAIAEATEQRRPLLVYVRCTDDRDGLPSAQTTLTADGIGKHDDGIRKDWLFRAGILADPDVHALVATRTVPLCVTYELATHGAGRRGGPWLHTDRDAATYDLDRDVGASTPGSLRIRAERGRHAWLQIVPVMGRAGTWTLRGKARIARGADAGYGLVASALAFDTGTAGETSINVPTKDRGTWQAFEGTIHVPANGRTIRVMFESNGAGTAWVDDLELVAPDGTVALVDGGIDVGPIEDPLHAFGSEAPKCITPALLVVDPKTKTVRAKLHRIGVLAPHFVDEWLRRALGDPDRRGKASLADRYATGALDDVVRRTRRTRKPESRRLRARALLRLGRLDAAEQALGSLDDPFARMIRGRIALRQDDLAAASEHLSTAADALAATDDSEAAADARFWSGFANLLLGRHGAADGEWNRVSAATRAGARAAACLLRAGPRLPLALDERLLTTTTADGSLPEQTEGLGTFDAATSARLLLRLQRADGAWGSHQGVLGYGVWDASLTAFADEALLAWRDDLDESLRARIDAAHDRAVQWLGEWLANRQPSRVDTFNGPYVLMHAVAQGLDDLVAPAVDRIVGLQEASGAWSVYGAHREASFNTALAVLALARARAAGHAIPDADFERGVASLARMRTGSGMFPYSPAQGHEWMTTSHGGIARETLCEVALLESGVGDVEQLRGALERFITHHAELRAPTKKLYDYFNSRGHGGYYFFFAHRNAVDAARALAARGVDVEGAGELANRSLETARAAVLAAREIDGSFVDKWLLGRAYGTAMALCILR